MEKFPQESPARAIAIDFTQGLTKQLSGMQNQDSIEFFAGIIPHDERQFENFIKYLMKEDVPVEIKGYHDDPHGYHMYTIHGSWDTYEKFQDYNIIKSLSHNYE